jgi:hypothetical protein
MRNKLQYSYSIAVFVGVLLTSYAMMSKEERAARPDAMVGSPVLRSDASTVDPAVAQLMEIESAIARYRKEDGAVRAPARRRTQTATPAPSRTGEMPVERSEVLFPTGAVGTTPDR